MKQKNEALRLADWLDVAACGGSNWNAKMNAAAAELRRLHSQRDALLEVLRALVHEGRENYVALDRGIGTETDAGKRWLNARAAIKSAEGEKA